MAIQLKRTSQTPKLSAATAPPPPKNVPKEFGGPAEQPDAPVSKGPPAKKNVGKPQDQPENTKGTKKDEADSAAPQKKVPRKPLSVLAAEVAASQKSNAGIAERIGSFLDQNLGLVTASVVLPVSYVLAEGTSNRRMLLAVLGASAAIMTQARLPERDLDEAIKRRAMAVMEGEMEAVNKALDEEREEADKKILDIQKEPEEKNEEMSNIEASIERAREEEKRLSSQSVTKETLLLYRDLKKMKELGVGGPLIAEMGRGIRQLLDKGVSAPKMRQTIERVMNGAVLTPEEWKSQTLREYLSEPDMLLPKALKLLGVESARPEIPLMNAAKAALTAAVSALTTSISRYPAAVRLDTQAKIDAVREATSELHGMTSQKIKLEEAALEGSSNLSLLQAAEAIRVQVSRNRDLEKSKASVESVLKIGESCISEVMECARVFRADEGAELASFKDYYILVNERAAQEASWKEALAAHEEERANWNRLLKSAIESDKEYRANMEAGASTRVRESFKSENPEPVVPEKPEMAPLPKPTCSAVQRSVWTDLSEDENKELWELISSFCATYGKDVELISKAAVNEPYQLTEEDYSVLRSACEMLGFKISEKKRADEALLSYLKIPIEKIEMAIKKRTEDQARAQKELLDMRSNLEAQDLKCKEISLQEYRSEVEKVKTEIYGSMVSLRRALTTVTPGAVNLALLGSDGRLFGRACQSLGIEGQFEKVTQLARENKAVRRDAEIVADLVEGQKIGIIINQELLKIIFSEEVLMGGLRCRIIEEDLEGARDMIVKHFENFGIILGVESISLKEDYTRDTGSFIKLDVGDEDGSGGDPDEEDEFLEMLTLLEDENEDVHTTTG